MRMMGPVRSLNLPAMAIAVLALIAAVAGVAMAGTAETSKKKRGLTAAKVRKIADAEIAAKAGGLSVASARTAGSAQTADSTNSLNGLRLAKVFAKIPAGGALRTIATFDVFTIRAGCVGSHTQLEIQPSTADTELSGAIVGQSGETFTYDHGSTDPLKLGQGIGPPVDSMGLAHVSITAARSGGFVLAGELHSDYPTTFNSETNCVVFGTVTYG